MIRLAEEKDFLQLAEMKWEHSAEDDVTYGETNIVGVDKQQFIDEFVEFLKNDTTYTVFVMELDDIVISAMYVAIINKVPKPKVSNYCLAYLTNVHTLEAYRNKGYGTAEHIAALKQIGPCPAHRRSFIRNFCHDEV